MAARVVVIGAGPAGVRAGRTGGPSLGAAAGRAEGDPRTVRAGLDGRWAERGGSLGGLFAWGAPRDVAGDDGRVHVF